MAVTNSTMRNGKIFKIQLECLFCFKQDLKTKTSLLLLGLFLKNLMLASPSILFLHNGHVKQIRLRKADEGETIHWALLPSQNLDVLFSNAVQAL